MGYFFSSLTKSATSTALDTSEWGLLIFGLVLTVGALGEYKMLPAFALKPVPRKFFELMVAAGIAGELIADGGVFLFSRHLQIISDGEYAAVNKEAGDAKERAVKLDSDLSAAKSDFADRQSRLATDLEHERQNTERMAKDNLVMQADVLRFRERLADRHLSLERQREISAGLKRLYEPFRPTVNIRVAAGAEPEGIARDIFNALSGNEDSAGWTAGIWVGPISGGQVRGVAIEYAQSGGMPGRDAIRALVSALRKDLDVDDPVAISGLYIPEEPLALIAAGVMAGRGIRFPQAQIRITIGKKP